MKYVINIHDDDIATFESYFGGAMEIIPSRHGMSGRPDVRVTSVDRLDPPLPKLREEDLSIQMEYRSAGPNRVRVTALSLRDWERLTATVKAGVSG
jgi:hypothetical protein